ncbi:MAG: hypothetical protein M3444_15830 [Acidobacteriota bacterium]|nr:hypothetical protein [Acidobacteriota bacterium]
MRCSYCKRHLRLLDPKRPLRLLLPRCRHCHHHTLGPVHKIVLALLAVVILYLLIGIFLPFLVRK